jgi:Acetyltransferase (GNAT) domain
MTACSRPSSARSRTVAPSPLASVPTDSFLWRHCHESRPIRKRFLVHVPYGKLLCHTIPLPATFEEYLNKLSGKARDNLRRQVRRLRALGQGKLELRRIDEPGAVPGLIDAVNVLRRGSHVDQPPREGDRVPVIDHDEFADLARRDMVLCYVLFCGDRPCAVATGMKYQGTYQVD